MYTLLFHETLIKFCLSCNYFTQYTIDEMENLRILKLSHFFCLHTEKNKCTVRADILCKKWPEPKQMQI